MDRGVRRGCGQKGWHQARLGERQRPRQVPRRIDQDAKGQIGLDSTSVFPIVVFVLMIVVLAVILLNENRH